MLTDFKQSLKALFSNPVRTGLTTLGVVIGIATVILVLSAGAGFRSLINAQLEAYGTNTLFAETRVPPTTKNRGAGSVASADLSRASSAVVITTLKNRDLQEIKQLPNVVNDYGMVVGQQVANYGNTVKNIMVYGVSAERFDIDQGTLKVGRFFTQGEDAGAAQVAILGSTLAHDFFGQEDAIGQLLKVGNLNYQVIGVYNSRGGLGGDEDSALFLPLNTVQKKILGIDYLIGIVAEIKNVNLGQATAEDIRLLLRRNHNITNPDKDDFLVQTQADALNTFNTIFNGITVLLIAIAAISLVVGGVGIMNIMYVVVTERTAEIGLKKALGARSHDILSEFLIESILITVAGGIVGIVLGGLLGFLVSVVATASHLQWTFSVPLYAIAIGFGVSAGIGILFGVLPARSASKLDPVEAMRYE